jgi:hypothetical protein
MSRRPPSTYLTADELKQIAAISIAKPYRRHRVPNSNFWYLLTGIRIWLKWNAILHRRNLNRRNNWSEMTVIRGASLLNASILSRS